MAIHFKKTISFILFTSFVLLCSISTSSADNPTLPTFKAQYKIKHNGIEIGHVALSVTKKGAQQYQITSKTETSGFLAFIRDDETTETSHFEMLGHSLRPFSYQYRERLIDSKKDVDISFDWENLQASNTSKGNTWKMDIVDGVVDKTLLQVALMYDLQSGKEDLTYQVADGGRLKTYAFKRKGLEEISIDKKKYSTVKLTRKKNGKPLITYYWCASELYYLPILVTRKKTYGTFEMVLEKVKFNLQKSLSTTP